MSFSRSQLQDSNNLLWVELVLTCRYITDARGLVIGLLGVMHSMEMKVSVTAFTAVEAYVLPSHLIQVSYLPLCAVRQETLVAASTINWHALCFYGKVDKGSGQRTYCPQQAQLLGSADMLAQAGQGQAAGQHMPLQSQCWWPPWEQDKLTAPS